MTRYYEHNKIFVPAPSGVEQDGNHLLSVAAQYRADRVAQAFLDPDFERAKDTILIAGGFNPELPPEQRGARLMADYLITMYGIKVSSILIEDKSTDISGHFATSLEEHEEFFDDVRFGKGRKKLAIVSQPNHLKQTIDFGAKVLGCEGNWVNAMSTWLPDSEIDMATKSKYAVIKPEIQNTVAELQVEPDLDSKAA